MEEQSTSIKEIISRNISLSKFAKCVCVSRPTLYKYMDAYDSKKIELIPDNILVIFDRASNETSKKNLHSYFNGMYKDYMQIENRRHHDGQIPPYIEEILDNERPEVEDIDDMIRYAEKHRENLLKRTPVDDDRLKRVTKDIEDLKYTRKIVEERQSENQFLLIFRDSWSACIGPEESDVIDVDEESRMNVPDIEEKFRFHLTRAKLGYTLLFYNTSKDDTIELQLLTGFDDDYTKDIIGTFHPEPGMKFIRIPDLFDEEFEEFFRYRIIRSNNGIVLNSAIGKFTI